MKTISAFDVIGPKMIGPSSSHTAGVLRIAKLTRKLLKGVPTAVRFILYGSFAHTYKGHATDRALVAGILDFAEDDTRVRDALAIAEEMGVAISFEADAEKTDIHPNTVDIDVTTDKDEHMLVRGVSFGGGRAELCAIDGVELVISGEYSTILVRHIDVPGVIAHMTGCFGESHINIAAMRVYREDKGRTAYAIIETDDPIPDIVSEQIEKHPSVVSSILIQ